jgi:hypothetical protein
MSEPAVFRAHSVLAPQDTSTFDLLSRMPSSSHPSRALSCGDRSRPLHEFEQVQQRGPDAGASSASASAVPPPNILMPSGHGVGSRGNAPGVRQSSS